MPPPSTETAPLGRPLLLLNLKVYPGSLGPAAERVARYLEELGRAAGVSVAIAPATPDLGRVAAAVEIPVLAQHVDPMSPGAHTGFVPAESIAAAGGRGSLVNHSEHPIRPALVAAVVTRLGEAGLAAVVCAPTPPVARRLARYGAPYLAIEPPELIGGDRAVSTARPEVITETVESVRAVAPSTSVLCGAGVHRSADVRRALELGARGILVASAVTRAPSPRAAIEELLAGF
ncbi:MAG: triose-phosphate isomerase [Thermoplasmata archaeon]|nr:triose-phosphate isomerase [Thermoplasmata archaeon]